MSENKHNDSSSIGTTLDDVPTRAALERLARETAWHDFLAQVTFSLQVWLLDPDLHNELSSPIEWMKQCSVDLNERSPS